MPQTKAVWVFSSSSSQDFEFKSKLQGLALSRGVYMIFPHVKGLVIWRAENLFLITVAQV